MPEPFEKDQAVINRVLSSLKRPKTANVLTFESPFSVLVMDRGFAMTEILVNEIKTFLADNGLAPVSRISAVTSFTANLDRQNTVSRTNTRLMVFHNDKDELEVVFFVGTTLEDDHA
jgi:hypothetical protein